MGSRIREIGGDVVTLPRILKMLGSARVSEAGRANLFSVGADYSTWEQRISRKTIILREIQHIYQKNTTSIRNGSFPATEIWTVKSKNFMWEQCYQ